MVLKILHCTFIEKRVVVIRLPVCLLYFVFDYFEKYMYCSKLRSSRKKSIPTPRKVVGNAKGEGRLKSQNFRSRVWVEWGGKGMGVLQRGVWIFFWRCTFFFIFRYSFQEARMPADIPLPPNIPLPHAGIVFCCSFHNP